MDNLKKSVLAIGAGAALLLGAGNAYAHSHLVGAAPAPRAVVASPSTIMLRFSEQLEPRFSGFDIKSSNGAILDAPVSLDAGDRVTLVGRPAKPLAPGIYNVHWHIVARDGHRMEGAFPFTVR